MGGGKRNVSEDSVDRIDCRREAPGRNVIIVGLCFFVFSYFITTIECITLSPVYWNLSNPIFKSSKNDHIISVNTFDEIDFVCPYYLPTDDNTDSTSMESYLIYQVSKSEYDDCSILSEHSARLLLSCSQPKQRRRFTIWFDPFQSVPNVPEYKPGQSYFFITPSGGHRSGLHNLYSGACLQHNMKLTIRIRELTNNEDEAGQRSDYIDVFLGSEPEEGRLGVRDDNITQLHLRRQHHHQLQQPHRHHHHQQPNSPAIHQNGRLSSSSSLSSSLSSSSSSFYRRRNPSRYFPVTTSLSRLPTGSLASQTTYAAPRDVMNMTASLTTKMGQVKGRSREGAKDVPRSAIPLLQDEKSVFSPQHEDLAVENTASSSMLTLASSTQCRFPFKFFLSLLRLIGLTMITARVLSH